MAIYTNLEAVKNGSHGIWSSALVKATISGHIWDVRVQGTVDGETVDIDVDNGVGVKVLGFSGNGYQERLGVIAAAKDKIGVTGSVAIVKDAFTRAQADEVNFYNKAGQDSKVYEIVGDEFDGDIFGVGAHQFSTAANLLVKDNYVTVDGNGGWAASATKPSASAYGFIGKIHSIKTGTFYDIVHIYAIQNEDKN